MQDVFKVIFILWIGGFVIGIFIVYSILFLPSIAKYAKKQNELLERQNILLEKILNKEKL